MPEFRVVCYEWNQATARVVEATAGPCATPATWRASGRASGSRRAFAWIKTIAVQTKTSFRGTARVGWAFTLAAAAYNLIRLPKLLTSLP